eukprot:CAMPEP_0115011486 /NCGR_PEP_ID=MMETSP0216-20121206/24032_1 /TAXON_ID=223996 /ORGANISM="Protocruzia adherens, Strain Boccale" /LENGTH=32 /DNA_ID= /DNA_START= /DNA_END= /DNA_ORIENTATION=
MAVNPHWPVFADAGKGIWPPDDPEWMAKQRAL